jgi:SLT domain-containing protein
VDLTFGQMLLQAAAERQGANAWRSVAKTPGLSDHVLAELATCSTLEEASADVLDQLLAPA